MKYLLILTLLLASCALPDPNPQPVEPVVGKYLITALDANGKVTESYVTSWYESEWFPRKVAFTTEEGRKVVLKGSFKIQTYNTP